LDFTDYEQLNMMIKGGYRIGSSEFSLRYERWEHENNFLLPPGNGIGVELENNQLQAIGTGSLGVDWQWKTSYTWNQNLRRANPAGQPLPVANDPDVDLARDSHTVRTEFTYGEWQDRLSGTLGAEGLYEDQESKGTTGLTPGGQVENLALFGMGRYLIENWSFEAGLRFDHRSQEADPSQTFDSSLLENRVDPVTGLPVDVNLENEYNLVTASLGAVYEFTDSFAVAANLNRGFRAPDLFELYADGVHGGVAAVQFGETNLDAETSLGGDLQARWRSETFNLTATSYVTSFANYIFLADTGVTDTGSGNPIFKIGQADATLYGGDISASWRPFCCMTANVVYELVRGEFDDGGKLPLLPADQLQLELLVHRESLGVLENPEFRICVRHAFSKDAAGPQEPFSQFDRNPNFGTASTDAYTLLDLGVRCELGSCCFDLEVRNVTDEAYRDFLDTYKGYALSPGRSINMQASYAF
jgi:iron complex outermembrane receptor protein/hemoglobin/transferrin/lactoferrin receptor protein